MLSTSLRSTLNQFRSLLKTNLRYDCFASNVSNNFTLYKVAKVSHLSSVKNSKKFSFCLTTQNRNYDNNMSDNRYCTDYAKRVAGCKKCKSKIEKGELRIAKITASPFSDDGEMKNYHHPQCIFETFKRARPTTKIIEEPGDIEGFENLKDEDKDVIKKLIKEGGKPSTESKGTTPKAKKTPTKAPATKNNTPAKKKASPAVKIKQEEELEEEGGGESSEDSGEKKIEARSVQGDPNHKDNSFREFRRLCATIAEEASYNAKTEIMKKFFAKGTDGKDFNGDLYVWVRLLLPGVVKRVYNLQSKQLVKIFSRIFTASEEEMLEDLEAGDVAETIAKFFEESVKVKEQKKSKLTIHDVDNFLAKLTKVTKEDDQQDALTEITKKCTNNDLKMIVRLIKGDLRFQAGAKHVLDGLHKDAYDAFNSSRNIIGVIDKVIELRKNGTPNGPLEVGASLMHPIQPMLAQPCSSVDMAFKKCPNGMYAEIKYDGERVQLHKRGNEFKYFSRSLKPVLPHKVKHFADYIPKAFPDGSDLILDAEVLLIDNNNGNPLPFGTLSIHKQAGFKNATPCLFVFDCIYYNGNNLINKPIKERRKFMHDHMVEVGNHVKFSEMQVITKKEELGNMIRRVLKEGLEGLVVKDMKSIYEPGKRHWLKIKKDYLNEGAMADSADLLVLGAFYGTGNKGGQMSIFLMGCYDPNTKKYCTVTKVHTGIDDETLEKLQDQLGPLMTKIKKEHDLLPSWINCARQMTPDFIAKDPKKVPVWEISGAEFTNAGMHTAAKISIRFPRITKMRDDKTWETATNLDELKYLFKVSKEEKDFDIDYSTKDTTSEDTTTKDTSMESIEDEDEIEEQPKIKEEPMSASSSSPSKVNGHSYNKTHIETEHGLIMDIIKGDLFLQPSSVSLAHCISRDYKLGKGIAKIFRNKFGRISELEKSGADIGGIAVLDDKRRFIYNLVTKAKYQDKPTYENLEKSLISMRKHARKNNVKEIAMPMIGCGLDGLQWNAVRTLIKNVFLKEEIKITVCYLDNNQSNNSNTQKVVKISPVKGQRSVKDMMSGNKRKSSDESEQESSEKNLKLDLPDVFEDCKFALVDDVENVPRLERYVVAFGGEILPLKQARDATHVIYKTETKSKIDASKTALHLTQDFLIDSIKLKKMQSPKTYSF